MISAHGRAVATATTLRHWRLLELPMNILDLLRGSIVVLRAGDTALGVHSNVVIVIVLMVTRLNEWWGALGYINHCHGTILAFFYVFDWGLLISLIGIIRWWIRESHVAVCVIDIIDRNWRDKWVNCVHLLVLIVFHRGDSFLDLLDKGKSALPVTQWTKSLHRGHPSAEVGHLHEQKRKETENEGARHTEE